MRLVAAGEERDRDRGGDERHRDEERPERHSAGERGGDDERAEDACLGGAEGGERAAGRPEALPVGESAGEEPDPDGVAGTGGHEGVDERAGAVVGAGVGHRDTAAADPDRAAPGGGGAEEGGGEAEPGEPEPFRVGVADGVQRLSDAGAEDLGRGNGREQNEQEHARGREAAAADPGADLVEHRVHNVARICFGREKPRRVGLVSVRIRLSG